MILSRFSGATQVVVLAAFHGIGCSMPATVVTGIVTSMLVHRPVLRDQWVDIHCAADHVPRVRRLLDCREKDYSQRRTPPMMPALLSTTEMSAGSFSRTFREFPPPIYR